MTLDEFMKKIREQGIHMLMWRRRSLRRSYEGLCVAGSFRQRKSLQYSWYVPFELKKIMGREDKDRRNYEGLRVNIMHLKSTCAKKIIIGKWSNVGY